MKKVLAILAVLLMIVGLFVWYPYVLIAGICVACFIPVYAYRQWQLRKAHTIYVERRK